jgi:hypothetical protein
VTESDWLDATDPVSLLESLRGRVTDRQMRLLACACCRRGWDALRDERSRHAVLVAERYADRQATAAELTRARRSAEAVVAGDARWWEGLQRLWEGALARLAADGGVAVEDPWGALAALTAFPPSAGWATRPATERALRRLLASTLEAGEEATALAAMVRDVIGNPFRPPPVLDPAWLAHDHGAVARLAQGIYNRRAFDRLPALADALADAGCDCGEMLAHCREPGEHVRGCWLLDLLLGWG